MLSAQYLLQIETEVTDVIEAEIEDRPGKVSGLFL